MDEEKYIRKRMGDKQPFRVPDHYFDDFASHVMSQLPEREAHLGMDKTNARRRVVALRTWICSAACLAVILLSTAFFFHREETAQREAHATENVADGFVDAAADYAMIDNTDIYAYLQDN